MSLKGGVVPLARLAGVRGEQRRDAGDPARQAANVAGVLSRTGATVAASATIQGVVDEGPRTPVEPVLRAFEIRAATFEAALPGAGSPSLG